MTWYLSITRRDSKTTRKVTFFNIFGFGRKIFGLEWNSSFTIWNLILFFVLSILSSGVKHGMFCGCCSHLPLLLRRLGHDFLSGKHPPKKRRARFWFQLSWNSNLLGLGLEVKRLCVFPFWSALLRNVTLYIWKCLFVFFNELPEKTRRMKILDFWTRNIRNWALKMLHTMEKTCSGRENQRTRTSN